MIETLLTSLYDKLLIFLSSLFNAVFGTWNWSALFSWLPTDILTAATGFILVCFGITLLRILKDILPF